MMQDCTSEPWRVVVESEDEMRLVAEIFAAKAAGGDLITLQGDLGAGKTTFARAFIRGAAHDDTLDVPSPTFTLVQNYDTARFEICHFDLYRLGSADELLELDFEDPEGARVRLVEWPDRGAAYLDADRFDVVISEVAARSSARLVAVTAHGAGARARLARIRALHEFLVVAHGTGGLAALRLHHLQGDASTRSYARLTPDATKPPASPIAMALVMDMPRMPDGPVIRDGKSYSAIAHLAEDAVPFVAIAEALRAEGLAAPEVFAFDAARGLALIEDFGDVTFGAALAAGMPQEALWHAALDLLIRLAGRAPPEVMASRRFADVHHTMPHYDAQALTAEVELMCDWYWPHITGQPMAQKERLAFMALWQPLIESVAWRSAAPAVQSWVLRDFHSPNLIWRAEKSGLARVGVIDFQDALIGHAAYDVMSLAQDARLDVPQTLSDELIARYVDAVFRDDADGGADFKRAAAILGAQRATKILGIFARLAMRDGKPGYLGHMPRIRRYLAWNLAHPALGALRAWFQDNRSEA